MPEPPGDNPPGEEPPGDKPSADKPEPPLADTGSDLRPLVLLSGLALVLGGLGLLAGMRRRTRGGAEQAAGFDDLL